MSALETATSVVGGAGDMSLNVPVWLPVMIGVMVVLLAPALL